MWIQRTPEETERWHASVERDAKSHGLTVAGFVWLAVSALLAGGVVGMGRFIVIADSSIPGGSFWTRFLICGILLSPFCWWLYGRERRSELARMAQWSICPQCETAGEGNVDTMCGCGGKIVHQSTVRWVDEPEDEKAGDSGTANNTPANSAS